MYTALYYHQLMLAEWKLMVTVDQQQQHLLRPTSARVDTHFKQQQHCPGLWQTIFSPFEDSHRRRSFEAQPKCVSHHYDITTTLCTSSS